jgi:hypothetical protein
MPAVNHSIVIVAIIAVVMVAKEKSPLKFISA